jgi:hypothetical protein
MADEGWVDETCSAHLYRVIAEVESGSPRSTLLLELAREAEGQAAIRAENAGLAAAPAYEPDLRMLRIGGGAGAITYFVGRLPGVSLS